MLSKIFLPKKELPSFVNKYHFVVPVTTKSFDPESAKPPNQVHKIDVQYGKQPHPSTSERTFVPFYFFDLQ
jgi:hypothetical protein